MKRRASAYLIAIGAISVLIILSLAFSRSTVSFRFSTVFANHEKRAEECAESSVNLTYRLIQEKMNEIDQFYAALKNPGNFFKNWYTQFRVPTAILGAYMDPVQAKNSKNQALNNGTEINLDLFSNTLWKEVYEKGITYRYTYPTPIGGEHANSPLMVLDKMLTDMGGSSTIQVTGRISQAFGILAKNPNYEIGGVTVPMSGATGFLAKLLNDINTEQMDFKFDLTQFLPDKKLIEEIPDVTITVGPFTIQYVPVMIPIPIPIGKILDAVGIGSNLTWRSLAKSIIGDAASFELDLSALKKKVQEHIYGLLPESFTFFKGNLSWGITIEKQGFLEVKADVWYQPSVPGRIIHKTLLTEREFRVADIQPVAPDYTFFVANSTKLYEDANIEKDADFQGDEQINWNDGEGALICHNFPSIESIVDSFKNIVSLDFKELNRTLMLPGLIRVNGTKPMTINLSITNPNKITDLRMLEMAALLLSHDKTPSDPCSHTSSDKSHKLIPGVAQVWYNPTSDAKSWDWPYWATMGGDSGLWLPFIIPRYARTLFFGNFHVEIPLSLKVEGNLYKKYSHLKFLIVKIYIPPIPPWFGGFGFAFPWPWYSNHTEPYGFCKYPPWDDGQNPAELWKPDEPKNFPANLYSPQQYLKKASYFYATSRDFANDLVNRSKDVENGDGSVDRVFVCDGVTFVNDNLWLTTPMKVMGRGMIVAAGNVHLGANITKREYDESGNPTIFSIVARCGAVINKYNNLDIHACIYADKGFHNSLGTTVNIHGNLVTNRFPRKACQGELNIHYESKHTRSSLLSMIKTVAKWDPTRYHVSMSGKTRRFEFVKN